MDVVVPLLGYSAHFAVILVHLLRAKKIQLKTTYGLLALIGISSIAFYMVLYDALSSRFEKLKNQHEVTNALHVDPDFLASPSKPPDPGEKKKNPAKIRDTQVLG